MIAEKIYKVSEIDNDTLHLINDKVKEIMSKLKQNLKKILVWQIYNTNSCVIRLSGKYLQQKYYSGNTNKIIVSQDFEGNTYSKNSMIICIINDKF